MDIRDIKPPGGFPELPSDTPATTPANSKPENKFADVAAETQGAAPTQGVHAALQLQRAALDDPGKLESAVRACVSELIDAGEQQVGQLSGADKKVLMEFLSSDPLLRQQIEAYLRKVAT
jgi:hypothetical protein